MAESFGIPVTDEMIVILLLKWVYFMITKSFFVMYKIIFKPNETSK